MTVDVGARRPLPAAAERTSGRTATCALCGPDGSWATAQIGQVPAGGGVTCHAIPLVVAALGVGRSSSQVPAMRLTGFTSRSPRRPSPPSAQLHRGAVIVRELDAGVFQRPPDHGE